MKSLAAAAFPTGMYPRHSADADRILDQEIGRIDVGMTDLSLCELLQGARNNVIASQIQADLRMVHILSTGGRELAISSAENYRQLRALGFTVRNTIDCLIATFCIDENHTLLHRDRDFDLFEMHLNLNVLHPPIAKTKH